MKKTAPPDESLVEIIDGQRQNLRPPSQKHDERVNELLFDFYDMIKRRNLGTLYSARTPLHLDKSTVVRPDLYFIAKKNPATITEKAVYGIPDLIVEVTTWGDRVYNHVFKKDLYEKFGVKEYWISESTSNDTRGYVYKDGSFGLPYIGIAMMRLNTIGRDFKFNFNRSDIQSKKLSGFLGAYNLRKRKHAH